MTDLGVAGDGSAHYVASTADTPACAFEIFIQKAKAAGGGLFSIAPAALVRRPKSDCTAFLRGVATVLGFSGKLPSPPGVSRLEASFAILGTNQSRSPRRPDVAGSFSSTPPGHWIAAKLFLADGEGEVFLNINAQDGIGEFSLKDEDYATTVVTELARILLPRAG